VTKLLKACAAGVTLLLLLAGCDNKVSLKEVEQKTTTQVDNETTKSVEVDTITKKPKFATYPFLDNFNLDSHGQFTVFIFGSKNCPYCEKLKEDISEDEELAFKLGQEFSTYYISMDGLTEHTLMHEKESMQTSNRVLADIYQVQATPTLIFLDKQVKSIFAVPGYMPRDQFKVTLDFITNEKWISAERGSKEMYDTIKAYYEEKGILTTKAEE
jgi:thioredoxin-related protein